MRNLICLLFALLMIEVGFTQVVKPNCKFGKVSEDELKMLMYDKDSSAHAVVLYDYGTSDFTYDAVGDKGWQIEFRRHVRVKIFDKEGFSSADFKIKLYHDANSIEEKLLDIDGFTFNLENGKVVKTKLERKSIMQKEDDKYHDSYSFAMPNVREGSVIDLSYMIKSDAIFNLRSWQFQYDIPVIWSEYFVGIPEFFIYKHTVKGYNMLTINDITDARRSISITSKYRSGTRGAVATQFENEFIDYSLTQYRIAMANVPAFIEEDYLTTSENYLSAYTFELSSTKSSDNVFKNYTNTWEKINELLVDSDNFGRWLTPRGFIEDEIKPLVQNISDPQQKLRIVKEYIEDKITWDEYNSLFANDLKKAWEDRKGSSGEINLALVNALKSAGFDANAVALSTRRNGKLNPFHPSVSDFNYVVACVAIAGDTLLLDATEPHSPVGILPERCLNGKGRLISKGGNSRWVNLTPKQADKFSANYNMVLNPDGSLSGNAEILHEGYNAIDLRNEIDDAASLDEFYKTFEKEHTGLTIKSKTLDHLDSLYKPLTEKLEFTIAEAVNMDDALVLVNPIQLEALTSNPFRLKERSYPVEFPQAINKTLVFNWSIPKGFAVEQLPKPAVVTLPNNGGKFTYSVVQNGENLMVISMLKINQLMFIPTEYANLKQFFAQVVAKQGESILLKKL